MKLRLLITFLVLTTFNQLNAQKWHQYSDSIWVYFQRSDVKNTAKYLELANVELSNEAFQEDSLYANYLLRKGLSASLYNNNYNINDLVKSLTIYENIRFKDPYKFFILNNFIGSYYYYNSIDSKSQEDYKKAFYHLKKSNDYVIKYNLRNDFILKNQLYSLAFLESVIFKNQASAKKYLIEFTKIQPFESSVKKTDMSYLSLLSFAGDSEMKEKAILAYIDEAKTKSDNKLLFKLYFEMLLLKDRSEFFKPNCLEVIKYGELAYNIWEQYRLPLSPDIKTIFIDLTYAYILINDNINYSKFKSLNERYFPNHSQKDAFQQLDEIYLSGDYVLAKQKFELFEQSLKSENNYKELIELYRKSISFFERGVIFNKADIQEQINYIKINQSKIDPSNKILIDKMLIEFYTMTGDFYNAHKLISNYLNVKNTEERVYFLSLNGYLCTTLGKFLESRKSFDIAIELIEKEFGKNDPRLLPYLTGAMFADLDGSDSRTLKLVSRTLKILYDNKLEKSYSSADAWKGLGKMALANYNYTDALSYFQKAKEINLENKNERGAWPNYIASLFGVFNVYLNLKQYEKAKEQLDIANAEILNKPNSPPIYLGDYYYANATYYYSIGEHEKAKENFEKSFQYYGNEMSKPFKLNYLICDYLLNRNYPKTMEELNSLSSDLPFNESVNFVKYIIMYKNGDLLNAQKLLLSNIKSFLSRINKGFHLMSDLQRETLYVNNSLNFEFLSGYLFLMQPNFLREYIDIRFYTKALLLSNSFKPNFSDEKQSELLNDWKVNKEKLDFFIEKNYNADTISNLQLKNREIEQILLSDKEKLFTPTLKSLTVSMSYDEAYVEIVRIKKQSPKIDKIGHELVNIFSDTVSYGAILIRKNSTPKFISIDEKSELESKFIPLYKEKLNSKLLDKFSYSNLFEKVDNELSGVKKVYFVPDGAYNLINLESIYNPHANKYLLQYLDIQTVTGCRSVLEMKFQKQKNRELKNVSIFGSPIFQIKGIKQNQPNNDEVEAMNYFKNLRGIQLSYLKGAEQEIQEIKDIAQKQKKNVDLYSGLNSTEDNLKKVVSPDILHIATHGYFYDSNDSLVKKSIFNVLDGKKNKFYSGTNSGLFLTGAQNSLNGKQISTTNNGILTSSEVSGLNLSNTDLVVLSACETGLGDNINGEGIYGLQRSFLIAGAKSVIMSLWKVNDTSTRFLMTSFYENLFNKNMSKFKAFKEAKLKLMKSYPNPLDWGGFVLLQ